MQKIIMWTELCSAPCLGDDRGAPFTVALEQGTVRVRAGECILPKQPFGSRSASERIKERRKSDSSMDTISVREIII